MVFSFVWGAPVLRRSEQENWGGHGYYLKVKKSNFFDSHMNLTALGETNGISYATVLSTSSSAPLHTSHCAPTAMKRDFMDP